MHHAKIEKSNLFETKPLCHKADPDTSFAAADKMIKSGALSRQEEDVWADIVAYILTPPQVKDFTAKEISGWGDMDYHTIQRRLSGLYRKGKINRIQIGVNPDGKPIYKKRNGQCVWKIVGS